VPPFVWYGGEAGGEHSLFEVDGVLGCCLWDVSKNPIRFGAEGIECAGHLKGFAVGRRKSDIDGSAAPVSADEMRGHKVLWVWMCLPKRLLGALRPPGIEKNEPVPFLFQF